MKVMDALLLAVLLAGCGGGAASTEPNEPHQASHDEVPQAERHRDGQIDRPTLMAVLDKGLGRFLQGVSTEPEMKKGKFVGFRIVEIYPEDAIFQQASPNVGDVVTQINGQPIGRPEQALKVWESLRVASELRIDYLREGKPREARYQIVD